MPRFYSVEIKVAGQPRRGEWQLRQGGNLFVTSHWGFMTVDIGQDEPKSRAQLVLEQILAEYARQQAKELERQGREMAAISRRVRRKPRDEKTPEP